MTKRILRQVQYEVGIISGRSCKAKRNFGVIKISYPQPGKLFVEKKICQEDPAYG